MKWAIPGFLILGLLAAPAPASAGLIGADVNVTFYYPNTSSLYCTNGNAVVGAGVEYPNSCSGFSPVSIDINDTQMIVDTGGSSWSTGAFNGFLLTILSGPGIVSAVHGGGTMNVTGLTVDGGNLWVNFAGQTGGIAMIDFETAAVPEPATLLLLGMATVGMIARRRRPAPR